VAVYGCGQFDQGYPSLRPVSAFLTTQGAPASATVAQRAANLRRRARAMEAPVIDPDDLATLQAALARHLALRGN